MVRPTETADATADGPMTGSPDDGSMIDRDHDLVADPPDPPDPPDLPEPPDAPEPPDEPDAEAPEPPGVVPPGPADPVAVDPYADRDPDARLARVHLRMGQLGLARAELEAMAGAAQLDDQALVDLAEVRWRTGDLSGAGEAATAYLDSVAEGADAGRPDSLVALVIAAESTAAAGRPGEARRLAGRVLDHAGASLDRVFAGMPRSTIWPHDPGDPGEPAGALFGLVPGPAVARERPVERPSAVEPPAGPTLWDGEARPEPPLAIEAGAEMTAAEADLAAGRTDRAAVRLSIVLRVAPSLAPAVLDAVAGVPGPSIAVLRGDAYRLVGRETQARDAFAKAARALAEDSTAPEPTAPAESAAPEPPAPPAPAPTAPEPTAPPAPVRPDSVQPPDPDSVETP